MMRVYFLIFLTVRQNVLIGVEARQGFAGGKIIIVKSDQ
jgi:hypothetical protein